MNNTHTNAMKAYAFGGSAVAVLGLEPRYRAGALLISVNTTIGQDADGPSSPS